MTAMMPANSVARRATDLHYFLHPNSVAGAADA